MPNRFADFLKEQRLPKRYHKKDRCPCGRKLHGLNCATGGGIRFTRTPHGLVWKRITPTDPMNDPNLAKTARALDGTRGLRFYSKKPEIIRKIFITEKTRLPLIIISTSIAAGLGTFAWHQYEQGKLTAERRDNEKRFIKILESSPAPSMKTNIIISTVTPPPKTSDSKPKVRAVEAEVNGQSISR